MRKTRAASVWTIAGRRASEISALQPQPVLPHPKGSIGYTPSVSANSRRPPIRSTITLWRRTGSIRVSMYTPLTGFGLQILPISEQAKDGFIRLSSRICCSRGNKSPFGLNGCLSNSILTDAASFRILFLLAPPCCPTCIIVLQSKHIASAFAS